MFEWKYEVRECVSKLGRTGRQTDQQTHDPLFAEFARVCVCACVRVCVCCALYTTSSRLLLVGRHAQRDDWSIDWLIIFSK